MYCKKCGKQIEDDSEFCRYCGASMLEKEAETSAEKAADEAQGDQGFFSEKDKEQRCNMEKSYEAAIKNKKRRTIITVTLVAAVTLIAIAAVIVIKLIIPQYYTDFEVIELENGTVAISAYHGSGGTVAIPEKLHFKTVTAIGDNAFKNNDNIEHITLPHSIESIGASAFSDCDHLEWVIMSEKIRTIGAEAFMSCDRFGGTSPVKDPIDTIGAGAFMDCKYMHTYIDALYSIGEMAYANCSTIEPSRTLAQSIGACAFANTGITVFEAASEEIGIGAFENCKMLTSVTLSANKTTIPTMCFNGCTKMTSLKANELILVDEYAFNGCAELYIFDCSNPDTADIADNAFEGCTNMKPKSQYNRYAGTNFVGKTYNHAFSVLGYDYSLGTTINSDRKKYIFRDKGVSFSHDGFDDFETMINIYVIENGYVSSERGMTDFIQIGMTPDQIFEYIGEKEIYDNAGMGSYYFEHEDELFKYKFFCESDSRYSKTFGCTVNLIQQYY